MRSLISRMPGAFHGAILFAAALFGPFSVEPVFAGDAHPPPRKPARVILASEAGAALNARLMEGGGTDDTRSLQTVLNRAADGRPVHLVIDGVARVSGLVVHGATTIECVSGGGLYLADGSRRAIIRNANRSRDAVQDAHITIRGCFLHGNRAKQPGDFPALEPAGNNQLADRSFIVGLEMLGVDYLTLENLVIYNARSFGALIGNGSRIDIRNVTVDHGGGADVDRAFLQTDGIHFKGPLQYVSIDNVRFRTGDDALAFNADDMLTDDLTIRNDFGPYVRSGPITDVTVNGVHFMDSLFGFRFLSTRQRIDRITISNVTGTINGPRLAIISNYMGAHSGNIGSIEFSNVMVDRSPDAQFTSQFLEDNLKIKERYKTAFDENNGGQPTLFNINGAVESLSLRNVRTKAADGRSLVRLGPNTKIRDFDLELSVLDPEFRARPLQIDAGAHVDQLRFSLAWNGAKPEGSGLPIENRGGVVRSLQWVDTPPRPVTVVAQDRRSIRVEFSQEVEASDYALGARITVGDREVRVTGADRDPVRRAAVLYRIEGSASLSGAIAWSYDAARGQIAGLSGDKLRSISAIRANAPETTNSK